MAADAFLSTLTYIQANLDADLSLELLAERAELSKFHFHRAFRERAGETLKQYTLRLRLERAAYRLVLHADSVLDIALDCGFANHETFTRGFRRRFGLTPTGYRKRGRLQHTARRGSARAEDAPAGPFELSRTRVCALDDMGLAFIRHRGAYEDVPDDLWARLARTAAVKREDGPLLLGIGYDSPAITDRAKLRYDAAIRVSARFRGRGSIGYQVLPRATYAMATFVGAYAHLTDVYPALVARAAALRGHRLIGLPCVEIYRTTEMKKERPLNFTDIYIPIEAQ